ASSNTFLPRTTGDFYLGFSPSNSASSFTFSNFTSTVGLNLLDSAATAGGVLRLTPAVFGQRGHVWTQAKQECLKGFDTTIQFQISNPGGAFGGADGLLFAIQNAGPTTSNLYVNMNPGLPPDGISVFFNTFRNWPGCFDF